MIKIPVCYSFDSPILDEFASQEYVPIGCGGYTAQFVKFVDSSGDNISFYNKYVNELTMIYWVAKHYAEIGDPDYIGFAHYRRYLAFDKTKLASNILFCAFEDQPLSLYQTYCLYHVKSDLDAFILSFAKRFPSLHSDFIEYLLQKRHAKCNMIITSRKLFFNYFSFIEPCIKICINEILPIANLDLRDRYQRRALGFILERMTGFWVYLKQKYDIVNIIETNIVEKNLQSIYSRPSYV